MFIKSRFDVMNNMDLRNLIFQYFADTICEQCKKCKVKAIKTKKFVLCYDCFLENWKTFFPNLRYI